MVVNMDAERGDRVRIGGKVGGMRGEGIPSRFGASQLMSEHWPQNLARSIYLIFACERLAPLSRPNCIFNLSGLKERGKFSSCLSPHTLSHLNKPISWTLRLVLNSKQADMGCLVFSWTGCCCSRLYLLFIWDF